MLYINPYTKQLDSSKINKKEEDKVLKAIQSKTMRE